MNDGVIKETADGSLMDHEHFTNHTKVEENIENEYINYDNGLDQTSNRYPDILSNPNTRGNIDDKQNPENASSKQDPLTSVTETEEVGEVTIGTNDISIDKSNGDLSSIKHSDGVNVNKSFLGASAIHKYDYRNDDNQPSSSTSSTERVMRFLQHPSLVNLSSPIKRSYLHSKGITDDVIRAAEEGVAENNQNQSDEDKNEKNIILQQGIWDSIPLVNLQSSYDSNKSKQSHDPTFLDKSKNQSVGLVHNSSNSQDQVQIHKKEQYHPQNYPPPDPENYHNTHNNNMSSTTNSYPQNLSYPHHNQNYNYSYNQEHQQPMVDGIYQSLPELPNPIVPMTLGGIITLFCVATFRWLNGEDFILFPQLPSPNNYNDNEVSEHNSTHNNEQDDEEKVITPIMNNKTSSSQKTDTDEVNNNYQQSTGALIYQDEDGEDCDENHEENHNSANTNIESTIISNTVATTDDGNEVYRNMLNDRNDNILSNDLKNLTMAIERYTALHERDLKMKSDEKAKITTDSAMDLLKNSISSSPSSLNNRTTNTACEIRNVKNNYKCTNQNDSYEAVTKEQNAINIATLVQIIEFKCAIKSISDNIFVKPSKNSTKWSKWSSQPGDIPSPLNNTDEDDLGNEIIQKLDEISSYLKGLEVKLSATSKTNLKTSSLHHNNKKDESSTKINGYVTPPNEKTSDLNETGFGSKKLLETLDESIASVSDNDEATGEKIITVQEKGALIDEQLSRKKNESNVTNIDGDKCKDEDDKTKDVLNDDKQDLNTKPPVGLKALKDAIEKMQNSNESTVIKSCAQMLFRYTSNLSKNPNQKQYRKIYTNNKTFTQRVSDAKYAIDILYAIGFVDEGKTCLEWKDSSETEVDINLLKEAALILERIKTGEKVGFASEVFDAE